MNSYYSGMFDLSRKSIAVIGGGAVAERKIISLLEVCPKITVISPELTDKLNIMVREDKIRWINRVYQQGDLRNCFLVIIATDNSAINAKIYEDVDHQSQFVNIVDDPKKCTFIVPSTIDRGLLRIAISTHGASPGLAKKIRKELSELYNVDYEEYTFFLAEMREWIFRQNIDSSLRKYFFHELLNDIWFNKISTEDKGSVIEEFKVFFKKEINKENG